MTEEQKLLDLQSKVYHQECLPHLYGWPWYEWAWEFFRSTNKYSFLCAANQISKSSTQIRKTIHWATETELWPHLWKSKPTQFWYFYPSKAQASEEFENKWVKEFLPRNELVDDPKYGWKADYVSKHIYAIRFNSGVNVYFKSYEQAAKTLQTASVYAVFADEEMPMHLYDELNMRMQSAVIDGYFNMVFTATLGQEFWRQTIEEKGAYERFIGAFKRQVSMYDCLEYRDGTKSLWTKEKIQTVIDSCKSEAEVRKRVYGEFIQDTDLLIETFARSKDVIPDHPLPKNWLIYSGVDIGSGGGKSHPAAIVFVAVKPDFSEGRVFKAWRGDGSVTTSGDILLKYRKMRKNMNPVAQYYDWQAKDFRTISERIGEPFLPADKGRDRGYSILNTLFKNNMLKIYGDDPELQKLVMEIQSVRKTTSKSNAKDDLLDALRFSITNIPWSYKSLTDKVGKKNDPYKGLSEREISYEKMKKKRNENSIEHLLSDDLEFYEANESYGFFGDEQF